MRRLGVFVFFDPQGIVDDYVLHLLGEMCTVCTEIVTVCNGDNNVGASKVGDWTFFFGNSPTWKYCKRHSV